MNKSISEDTKKKIINEYLNTKRTLRKISEKYEIEFENLIGILEEYKKSLPDGSSMMRTKREVTNELLEEIDELRKKGLTYSQISNRIGVSTPIIRDEYGKFLIEKVVSEYWDERIKKDKRSDSSKKIDKKICELREKDLLQYKEIAKELENEGITMTHQRVEQRYHRFSKINKKQLVKMILNLKKTRNATMEQMQQIADYYGVDLEKELNLLEGR